MVSNRMDLSRVEILIMVCMSSAFEMTYVKA